MKETCNICPAGCVLSPGQTGACRSRRNENGKIISINYGRITSIALDPIEKKPLQAFMPGSSILSVGSFGCNLHCPFCQNHSIAAADEAIQTKFLNPEELIKLALETVPQGNIGIAYTYNEPLVGYEFVADCAKLAHENGLKNVLVTNGYINEKPFRELLPHIDAMNIDLKCFNEAFYKKLGGDLETVKRSIRLAAESCHVEVTTLIIPGENDSPEEMRALSAWLSGININIPLHISRFFPAHEYTEKTATPIEMVHALAEACRENLAFVYTGNC